MSLLVSPSGAPVFADPIEGEMEAAYARMRRLVAVEAYSEAPCPILDAHGEPVNRLRIEPGSVLAAWLSPGKPKPPPYDSYRLDDGPPQRMRKEAS